MKMTLSAVALGLALASALVSASCGTGGNLGQLVSIKVIPNPASINAPGSIQLTAIGIFGGGKKAILPSVTWTSSSQDVGVSNSGLATCSLAGGPAVQATVTASASSGKTTVSGSTTLFCAPPVP